MKIIIKCRNDYINYIDLCIQIYNRKMDILREAHIKHIIKIIDPSYIRKINTETQVSDSVFKFLMKLLRYC